jgi:hypothetical protein
LCHPDIVVEELKEQAHGIMTELNSARQKKDLNKVLEILNMLISGGFVIASDNIFDKDLLKTKIVKTKAQIDELKTEIDELETSDTYENIQSIDDKDEYFSEIKVQLVEESERLEKELNQLKCVDIEDTVDIKAAVDFEESNKAFFAKYAVADEAVSASDANTGDYWKEEF